MKIKLMLLSSVAVMSLAACQNQDVENKEKEQEHQSHTVEVSETTNEKDVQKTVEDKEVETEVKSSDENTTVEHQHKEDNSMDLKAEDIIVSYFNAISLGDIKTMEKLYPSGSEENAQMAKLFGNSKITTDIVGMKKISLNEVEAIYDVEVKISTKEEDNNFTDNKSGYQLKLDMSKGIISHKAVTTTDYLE